MKGLPVFAFILLLISYGCGPNAEQQAAREKEKIDSAIKATQNEEKRKFDLLQMTKDSISDAEKLKNSLETDLITVKGDLELERLNLDKIKEFHFGRTSSEKESQIRDQVAVIDKTQKRIEKLQDEISKLSATIIRLQNNINSYK